MTPLPRTWSARIDVAGGVLDVNLTEEAVEAKGEISIKGVPAELAWQRIFSAPDERQPPIRVTARLDAEAREKLGIKVNHLVQGPTPITLQIARLGNGGPPIMNMQADLTDAQLLFGGLGWTKPAGHAATIKFDIVPKEDGSTDLDNLKILGDDIDIQGGIALDPAQHLKEFYFSDFSVNRLTHVEITATVRDDQVLEIKAQGPSYDGKQFFQSLFSAGQFDGSVEPAEPFGVDFTAQIGTVAGFYDTTAKDVQVTMKKRNGRLIALDATGRAERQRSCGGPSRAERQRAPDQGRSARCRRCVPPCGLLSERRRRRGVAGGQSRCRRTGRQEWDAVGARFHCARRFGGERRPYRSELDGGVRRTQAAGRHPAAPRLQSIARTLLRRRRQIPA